MKKNEILALSIIIGASVLIVGLRISGCIPADTLLGYSLGISIASLTYSVANYK